MTRAPRTQTRDHDRPDDAGIEARLRKVELAISLVLRGGVVVSVAVIAAGLALMFAHHDGYAQISGPVSYHQLTSSDAAFPHTLSQLGRALAAGEGRGVVVLGLLVLILTPVIRVAVSVLSFVYERDLAMTALTAIVLAALVGSFVLAGVVQ